MKQGDIRQDYSGRKTNTKAVLTQAATLLDKLQLCQRALREAFTGEDQLRTAIVKECRGVPEIEHALFKPAPVCGHLFADTRSSTKTSLVRQQFTSHLITEGDQFYLDRR